MDDILGYIERFFAFVLSVVMAICVLFGVNFGTKDGTDQALLSAAIVSDTHQTNEIYRYVVFDGVLDDISANVDPDLFICAGDCTDNGNETNWAAFADSVEKHLTVKNRIIALGNHDTWTSYDTPHDYDEAKAIYLKYSNQLMGTDNTEVYFTYELKGYHFIVMGSEGTGVGTDVSDTQLAWLDSQLAAAASDGKPIFVIHHQPLNFTHTVGDNENGNGYEDNAQCDKCKAILDKYENVFYISGHQHYGLNTGTWSNPAGFTTIEKVGKHITSVNLPSMMYGGPVSGGDPVLGTGVVMFVYEDRVEFAGRNFVSGGWLGSFDVTIPLS